MEQRNDILWRMRLIYFIMAFFGLLVIGKVLYIQFAEGEYWRERARRASTRYATIEAVRGDIFADDGRLLATSVPVFDIRMDVSRGVTSDDLFFAHVDSLSLELSRLFRDRSAAQYRSSLVQARRAESRYYLVKRNVSWDELQKLKEFPLFRLGRFGGGLIVEQGSKREMPYKSLAARTIGYEREGVYVGLEGAYRDYLEGVQGKRLEVRAGGGTWMPVSDQNEIQPQNGKDLVSTINVWIQDITEKALEKQLRHFSADHGTAIVMEVATGKVKAISNLSRNERTGSYEETYNYAIGHSIEPGSTFKTAALLAAIEDGHVTPFDSVDTRNGEIHYYGRIMRDVGDESHGTISIQKALEISSNVGVSQTIYKAYRDQPQQFTDRLRSMHLQNPLGIEISGEGRPLIRNAGDTGWSRLSLPWMSIGYEVSLTPMQTLAFYNAIANDGRMMKPMFVKEIRQSGRTVKKFRPTVLERSIAGRQSIEYVRQMLEGVVENGTGKNIHTPHYTIAGKTGTAQIAESGRGYFTRGAHARYQASFAGYFPARDPKYSCIVVINNPKGYIVTGSQVAAPVFREISDKMFAARMFMPDVEAPQPAVASLPEFRNAHHGDVKTIYDAFPSNVSNNANGTWIQTRVAGDSVTFREREYVENLVPNVEGMGIRDAIYMLENAGLKVLFRGRGTVTRQRPRAGSRAQPGSTVTIDLS